MILLFCKIMPLSIRNVKTIIPKIPVGKRSFGKRRRKIRGTDRERVERSSTWDPRVRFPPFRFRRMNETSIIVFVVRLPIRNFRNAAQPRSKGGLRLKKYYVTRIFARHPLSTRPNRDSLYATEGCTTAKILTTLAVNTHNVLGSSHMKGDL